jgi:alcohol dehydrogenase
MTKSAIEDVSPRHLIHQAGWPSVPEFVADFQHAPGTQVHFGLGQLSRLGSILEDMNLRRPMIVTDAGIAAAGHLEAVQQELKKVGITAFVFDRVIENPTTETVETARLFAEPLQIDAIIGLGGGSSMDTAKGCNFLLTNGGKMQNYHGIGKATHPMLPLIVIPTTAGTGSECQSFALISDALTHVKMACGDKKAAARHAILDPLLTLTQPPRVTALTGFDAYSHAIESYVCTKRSPISQAYSRAAYTLLHTAFPQVLNSPSDLTARAMMLLGAALSGTAIENAMLGAAHALANPLTARYGTTHGAAVALTLPHVIRYNAADPAISALYRELNAEHHLAEEAHDFAQRAGLTTSLSAIPNFDPSHVPELAAQAAQQWTGTFNPRPINTDIASSLYRSTMG